MMRSKIAAVCLLAIVTIAGGAATLDAAKKSVPEFASSGRISGTELVYENLAINSKGIAVVTIHNPTSTGVSFSATFSFFNSKGKHLDSFTVSGFAHRNSSSTHAEEVTYSNIRTAKSVKVLGRAGRTVDD